MNNIELNSIELSTSLPFPTCRTHWTKNTHTSQFSLFWGLLSPRWLINIYIHLYNPPPPPFFGRAGGGGVGGLLFWCGDLHPWQVWRKESWKHITYSFSYIGLLSLNWFVFLNYCYGYLTFWFSMNHRTSRFLQIYQRTTNLHHWQEGGGTMSKKKLHYWAAVAKYDYKDKQWISGQQCI